jgi:hypothetical protein
MLPNVLIACAKATVVIGWQDREEREYVAIVTLPNPNHNGVNWFSHGCS